MQSIFEQFDDLDIIINNAGVSQFCSLWEETVEHWDYVLNSNLRAMFLISREYMINRRKKGYKERYGRIVNISSTRSLMSEEGTEAYTASKGGVTALTHALAVSFAPYAVTVNSISRAGSAATAMTSQIRRSSAAPVRPGGKAGGCGFGLLLPHR